MRLPTVIPLAVLAVVLAACVVGQAPIDDARDLTPTFPALEASPTPSDNAEPPTEANIDPAADATATSTPTASPGEPTDAPTDSSPTTPAEPTTTWTGSSEASDDPNDRTTRVGGSPAWADLAHARLLAQGDRVVLDVTFGAAAPSSTSGDETFNVALFSDLTGDGFIDIEVWSNLGPHGWGTAVFDNRTGQRWFTDDSPAVATDHGGALQVTFPWSLLDEVRTWRWALSSEYGTPAELGTILAARDDLPDDQQPVLMRTQPQ
jgi:hypothetical protein